MMLNPDPLAVLRLKLRRAGYFPIPCEGKAPPLKGWQDSFNTNAEEISLWSKSWHMARNTGVLAKHTPALDIDLMDEDACEAIETLVGQLFEDGRVLVRIGKAPKRLIPFRTSVPFKKLILAVTAPNGVKSKLEVLGDGQHYVVDGIHPETRAAYCWHGADHLADVPVRDLPLIRDAAHAQEVLDRIGQMLVAEHGYTLEQKQQQQQDDDHPRGDPADWAELMRRILTGTDIHDAMVSLSASHASCGMPLEGSTRTLRSLLLASALPRDERFRERINDVERTVRSGYAKFAPPTEQEATPALDCDPWWRDPATIPPRQFLHGKHYSRRNIGAPLGLSSRPARRYRNVDGSARLFGTVVLSVVALARRKPLTRSSAFELQMSRRAPPQQVRMSRAKRCARRYRRATGRHRRYEPAATRRFGLPGWWKISPAELVGASGEFNAQI